MLTIRPDQIETFRRSMEADFRRRVCLLVRKTISREVMDDGDLTTKVETGIRQARECGFQRETDIARFVEALCIYLGGIPEKGLPKPMLPILYAYKIDPEIKLRRFIECCRRHSGTEGR